MAKLMGEHVPLIDRGKVPELFAHSNIGMLRLARDHRRLFVPLTRSGIEVNGPTSQIESFRRYFQPLLDRTLSPLH
jgi:hypothetical protein